MDTSYLLDYFLFTFFASFGVIQIALSKKISTQAVLGIMVLLSAYLWFFSSRDRGIPTIVEGSQLFIMFGTSAVLALAVTKLLIFLKTK